MRQEGYACEGGILECISAWLPSARRGLVLCPLRDEKSPGSGEGCSRFRRAHRRQDHAERGPVDEVGLGEELCEAVDLGVGALGLGGDPVRRAVRLLRAEARDLRRREFAGEEVGTVRREGAAGLTCAELAETGGLEPEPRLFGEFLCGQGSRVADLVVGGSARGFADEPVAGACRRPKLADEDDVRFGACLAGSIPDDGRDVGSRQNELVRLVAPFAGDLVTVMRLIRCLLMVCFGTACAPLPEKDTPDQVVQSGGIRIGILPTGIVPPPAEYLYTPTVFPGGDPDQLRCPGGPYIRIEVQDRTSSADLLETLFHIAMPAAPRLRTWNIPWGDGDAFPWAYSYGRVRFYGTTAPLVSVMRAVRSSPVGRWTAYSVSYPGRQPSVSGTALNKEALLSVFPAEDGSFELQVDVWPYGEGTHRRSGVQVDVGVFPARYYPRHSWTQSIRIACLPEPSAWDGVGAYPSGMSHVYQAVGSTLWVGTRNGCPVCEMR